MCDLFWRGGHWSRVMVESAGRGGGGVTPVPFWVWFLRWYDFWIRILWRWPPLIDQHMPRYPSPSLCHLLAIASQIRLLTHITCTLQPKVHEKKKFGYLSWLKYRPCLPQLAREAINFSLRTLRETLRRDIRICLIHIIVLSIKTITCCHISAPRWCPTNSLNVYGVRQPHTSWEPRYRAYRVERKPYGSGIMDFPPRVTHAIPPPGTKHRY